MQIQYHKHYSGWLNREMEFKVYGHGGKPVLFIPCQDGRFFDFESFKMTDVWAPWIESGQVMVFACDSIDNEAWAAQGADNRWRIENHEKWFNYITTELVPAINHYCYQANGNVQGIMTFGCSMGATHAGNLFFRRPDLFDRVLALSGIYTADYGWDGYMDEVVYQNSPVHYMANMPADHPYIQRYNRNKGIICVGQGAWEQPETSRRIDEICREKGINVWVDFWGYDVNHDWPWWHKQVEYFVPKLLAGKK